jgi:hypothetical protein
MYHERQRLQHCCKHTLNNLFQGPIFSFSELDSICAQLAPGSLPLLNPHRYVAREKLGRPLKQGPWKRRMPYFRCTSFITAREAFLRPALLTAYQNMKPEFRTLGSNCRTFLLGNYDVNVLDIALSRHGKVRPAHCHAMPDMTPRPGMPAPTPAAVPMTCAKTKPHCGPDASRSCVGMTCGIPTFSNCSWRSAGASL